MSAIRAEAAFLDTVEVGFLSPLWPGVRGGLLLTLQGHRLGHFHVLGPTAAWHKKEGRK